jgi:hypothetical protein
MPASGMAPSKNRRVKGGRGIFSCAPLEMIALKIDTTILMHFP